MIFYLFFFSSRRLHTRWPRDWSSDVCSSDLGRRRLLPEVFTQNDAEEKGDAAHEREHPHELQVMRTVETANGFAQGVNAIGKREERINSLEESGQKLNGIKA